MISEKYKVVFVHIPKNAGNTIVNHYFKNQDNLEKLAPKGTHSYKYANTFRGLLNGGICSASKRHGYLNKCEWLKSIWDEYKKFAVVRNPYDRFISGLKHADKLSNGDLFFDAKDNLKKDYLKKIKKISTLAPLVQQIPKYNFFLPKSYNRLPSWHTHIIQDQRSYLVKDNSIVVDDIIRFENLQEEFNNLCKQYNLPIMELPKSNTAKKRVGYEKYLEENKDLVSFINENFAKDFELFNYKRLEL